MKIRGLKQVAFAMAGFLWIGGLTGCRATKEKIAEMKDGPKNTACDLGMDKLKNASNASDNSRFASEAIATCKADITHNDKPRLKMNLAIALRAYEAENWVGATAVKSRAEARIYLQQAADQGYAPAQMLLASIMDHEDEGNESARHKQAASWYRKAAEQGEADAQLALSEYFSSHGQGFGTGQSPAADDDEALKWSKMAAEQGNADGETYTGIAYESRKSYGDAAKWFRKAADQGNHAALNLLSELYEQGNGVPQSNTEAFKLVMRGAEAYRSDATSSQLDQFERRHSEFGRARELVNKGRSESNRRDYDGAIRDITQAIQTVPDVAYFYVSRGYAHFKKGSYSEATQDCDYAVKLNPNSASALYCRGVIKKAVGDSIGSAKDIADAQAIQPRIGEEF